MKLDDPAAAFLKICESSKHDVPWTPNISNKWKAATVSNLNPNRIIFKTYAWPMGNISEWNINSYAVHKHINEFAFCMLVVPQWQRLFTYYSYHHCNYHYYHFHYHYHYNHYNHCCCFKLFHGKSKCTSWHNVVQLWSLSPNESIGDISVRKYDCKCLTRLRCWVFIDSSCALHYISMDLLPDT